MVLSEGDGLADMYRFPKNTNTSALFTLPGVAIIESTEQIMVDMKGVEQAIVLAINFDYINITSVRVAIYDGASIVYNEVRCLKWLYISTW